MKNFLINFGKGFVIGGFMLVPGVSGGNVALILDVYDKMIYSASNLFKDFKHNIMFLLGILLGALCGIVVSAKVLGPLFALNEIVASFFFMGIITGSVPLLTKKAKVTKFSWKWIVFPLIGLVVVIASSFLPSSSVEFVFGGTIENYLLILAFGIVGAIALVLPGISFTMMLTTVGLYDKLLSSINIATFDLTFLIIFAIATLIGVVLVVKILDYLLTHYETNMYLMIIGFVVGSILIIMMDLNTVPTGWNILWSVLAGATGFAGSYFVTTQVFKKEKQA